MCPVTFPRVAKSLEFLHRTYWCGQQQMSLKKNLLAFSGTVKDKCHGTTTSETLVKMKDGLILVTAPACAGM